MPFGAGSDRPPQSLATSSAASSQRRQQDLVHNTLSTRPQAHSTTVPSNSNSSTQRAAPTLFRYSTTVDTDADRYSNPHYDVERIEHPAQAEIARRQQLFVQQASSRARLQRRLADQAERETQQVDIDFNSVNDVSQAHQHDRDQSAQAQRPRQRPKEQHPVFLLNCKACGSFLSDRGMRAVLLLKPHVTLYSTDVMPANCGPLYPPKNEGRGLRGDAEPATERTCNCLTQSLGCYGCGAQVGYHIVAPCVKCTSSVNELQRGSNGHRCVLHCSEIDARQRRYVPGEKGVIAAACPAPFPVRRVVPLADRVQHPRSHYNHLDAALHAAAVSRNHRLLGRHRHSGAQWQSFVPRPTQDAISQDVNGSMGHRQRLADSAAGLHPTGLRGMQLPRANVRMQHFDTDDALSYPDGHSMHPFDVHEDGSEKFEANHAHTNSRGYSDTSYTSDGDRTYGRSSSPRVNSTEPRMIRRGSVVYWSDLVSGGERTEPIDADLALQLPIAGR